MLIGLLRTHAGLQHQLLGTVHRRSQDVSKGRLHFVKVRVLTRLSCRVSFCSSLMVIVPGIFPLCFSSPFLISPRAPITTGIISVFIPPILIISIQSLGLYLESFSVIFDEGFLWDGTAISKSLQVLFIWSLIIISGLLVAISLSVSICIVQSIVASLFSVTVAGSCS